jgi:hypothetical protein
VSYAHVPGTEDQIQALLEELALLVPDAPEETDGSPPAARPSDAA